LAYNHFSNLLGGTEYKNQGYKLEWVRLWAPWPRWPGCTFYSSGNWVSNQRYALWEGAWTIRFYRMLLQEMLVNNQRWFDTGDHVFLQ
jgi:hypothetical protein